ncbi:MAG TPA: LytTR family DNA-binding domain-containing protein [Allosphingosinicella sp.]|nr:LytTR family DNA-binding domain-containing protein [Allosphingosinicella sp.]
MQSIRAMLIDDEPLAIRRLSRSLQRVPGVEVVGSTTSARDAVTMIAAEKPDLILLDIAMPGLTGFEVLERIPPETRPAVIFVTAYDAHAVQAFDVAAADYLMKPWSQARLEEAVDRGRLWLEARAARDVKAPLDSLWVHRHRAFVRIWLDEIEWIEGHGDYARVHAGESTGLARTTLKALEERLDPDQFIRVHRSAICRRAAIVGLHRKPTGAHCVSLASGAEAPVGRRYMHGLKALLHRTAA